MSVRINQRWPDGLKERIEAKVGKSQVTAFTVEALEKALSGSASVQAPADRKSPGDSATARSEPASSRTSEPPATVTKAMSTKEAFGGSMPKVFGETDSIDRYQCPRDCNPAWRPTSPKVRCPSCHAAVVPA